MSVAVIGNGLITENGRRRNGEGLNMRHFENGENKRFSRVEKIYI